MSTAVTVAGVSHTVPALSDSNWGSYTSLLLIALATPTKVLQTTSTTFTLAGGDVDFGATYGLKPSYIKSRGTNPSATGVIRLANAEAIGYRNAANSADISLLVNASDRLTVGGTNVVYATDKLSTLGATTSAELASIISDETGTGSLVFSNSPVFTTPNIGSATGSISGNAATVTTNANLTGMVTSVGNATTVVTNANLTGGVTSVGNAATVITNANLTGGVTSVGNAATVITNANLTGPITSVGNATSIASQTGTGTKIVVDNSPTLITPNLGTPSTLVGTNITGTGASFTAGNATAAVTSTNLAGGAGGSIPYQSASGTTALLANGSSGQVLTSAGTTLAPTWTSPLTNPMTTGGDIIYGGSAGATTRLANGSSGQVLTSAGGTNAPSWAAPTVALASQVTGTLPIANGGTGRTTLVGPSFQVFTTGTGTYTTPAGVRWIRVIMAGGGGGGGSSGTASTGNGSNGSNTTFGSSLLTAGGGAGGGGGTGSAGAGGTPTVASPAVGIGYSGGTGGGYNYGQLVNSYLLAGSRGGDTPFIGGGGQSGVANSAGVDGKANTGGGGQSGGTGAATNIGSGGGGGSGAYINAIITNPSATYNYVVGAGGALANAGTSGFASGSGGSGVIIVEEYYS